MKTPQSPQELDEQLELQLQFIELSADAFDRGFVGEAKRLATTIRVLCHDTKNSHSLLGQLGRDKTTTFPDSAVECTPPVSTAFAGLVRVTLGFDGGTRYVAPLDDEHTNATWVEFANWWEGPVFVLPPTQVLSRRWLITTAANQDGGAHVDPKLDDKYREIRQGLGWEATVDGSPQQLDSIHLVSLRQVAHEVLKALKPGYGKKQTNLGLIVMSMPKIVRTGDIGGIEAWRPSTRIDRPDGSTVQFSGPEMGSMTAVPAAPHHFDILGVPLPGPHVEAATFCEEVRHDDGRMSLVRLVEYASEELLVDGPVTEDVSAGFFDRPFLTDFTLYFCVSHDRAGTHNLVIRLAYDDGTIVADHLVSLDFSDDQRLVRGAVGHVGIFPKAGTVCAEFWIDGVFKTKTLLTLRRTIRSDVR